MNEDWRLLWTQKNVNWFFFLSAWCVACVVLKQHAQILSSPDSRNCCFGFVASHSGFLVNAANQRAHSCKQQRTSSILYSFFFFLLHFSPAVTCLQPCGLALDAVMDNFAIPDEWEGGGEGWMDGGRGGTRTHTRSRAFRGFSGLIQISSHASDVGYSVVHSFFLSFLLLVIDRLLTWAFGGTYQLSWSPHTRKRGIQISEFGENSHRTLIS